MAVSQVGSTTTSYYVTNGANGASASSKTVTSSSTTVSSTTTRSGSASTTSSATAVSSTTAISRTTKGSGSASTTSSTTAISSTTSYASATAKTTCSTTVTYSGSSSTAKVSSTTAATVEATSTNKVGSSASTTASTTISASKISSSTSVTILDKENSTNFLKGLVDYFKGMLDYYSDFKDGVLDVQKDILSAIADFIAEAEEWANDRNSIDESDEFANMNFAEILVYRVNNAVNPLCVEAFMKCIDKIGIGDIDYDDTAKYEGSLNLIFFSLEKDIYNDEGAVTSFLHEIGHGIDDVLDWNDDVSNDFEYDFVDVLRQDYNNFVSEVQDKYDLTTKEAYEWIEKWLWEDQNMKGGVSDLITGLSNGNIAGPWLHTPDYYTDAHIENEAFANFFEVGMSYKPIKLKYMKEVFPNAYKKFEEMLRDRLY